MIPSLQLWLQLSLVETHGIFWRGFRFFGKVVGDSSFLKHATKALLVYTSIRCERKWNLILYFGRENVSGIFLMNLPVSCSVSEAGSLVFRSGWITAFDGRWFWEQFCPKNLELVVQPWSGVFSFLLDI